MGETLRGSAGILCALARRMLLRIDTLDSVEGITVIQVKGELVGEGVAELRKVLDAVEGPSAIDLALLRTADAEGVRTLAAAARGGASLLNASPYVELLIERESSKEDDV